jgi:signal-transduction protein with cAMP-binding, CBS, and nucleotidyltransferase domain
MLSDPVSITADATLGAALRVMHAQRVSSLPVVDAGGRVEGIITRQDLLSLMCRMLALDHEGSSVELALHEEKTDLVAAFEVLNSLKTEVLSAVASLVRDDGDEPALYLRIAQRNPRPVESALARAGLILLEPEMEAERLDSAEQPVK